MNIKNQILVKGIFNRIAQMFGGATLARSFAMALFCAVLFLPGSVLAAPPADKGKDKDKNNGGGNIAVEIEFRDAFGDGLRSDDKGAYVNGVANVKAEIDEGLLLNPTKGNKKNPDTRRLSLDFSKCVGTPDNCLRPSESGNVVLERVFLLTSRDQLRVLPVGQSKETSMIVEFNTPEKDRGPFRLVFDDKGTASECPMTHLVQVLRSKADEWKFTAELGENSQACLTESVGGGTNDVLGIYDMPFQFTVTKL